MHHTLIAAVEELTTSSAWLRMLQVAARFRDYLGGRVGVIEHRELEPRQPRPGKDERCEVVMDQRLPLRSNSSDSPRSRRGPASERMLTLTEDEACHTLTCA